MSRNTPWSWARVVRAATELTPGQKLVWLEIADLDYGPDGVFATSAAIARRLGTGQNNVEKAQGILRDLGLLTKTPSGWKPTLPPEATPAFDSPSTNEVWRLADLLDGHVRTHRQPSKSDTVRHSDTAPVRLVSDRSAGGASREGGKGGEPVSYHKFSKPMLANSVSQQGGESERGEDWRKILEQYLGPRPSTDTTVA